MERIDEVVLIRDRYSRGWLALLNPDRPIWDAPPEDHILTAGGPRPPTRREWVEDGTQSCGDDEVDAWWAEHGERVPWLAVAPTPGAALSLLEQRAGVAFDGGAE